jgi:acetamidase/formamidase
MQNISRNNAEISLFTHFPRKIVCFKFMWRMILCSLLLAACSRQDTQLPGEQGRRHVLNPSPQTIIWGNYHALSEPVLRIKSGDIVALRTLMVGTPAMLEEAGVPADQIEQDLRDVHREVTDRGPGGHILTGPIYIEEAEPGDVLEVNILSIELVIPFAFNRIGATNGFLSNEFSESRVKIVPLDEKRGIAHFSDDIKLPLRPFFGSMGVAPPEEAGRINSSPPWIHAGNLDNRELIAGTTLYIPVHVKGALFQIGDGHAAQGNGEVDITALETSLKGELRFTVRKDMHLTWPRAETDQYFITMGTDEDLTNATRIAVREMIDFLVTEKSLTREDAYMLSSVAVNLSITQLVDGKKGVHAMILKSIFTN